MNHMDLEMEKTKGKKRRKRFCSENIHQSDDSQRQSQTSLSTRSEGFHQTSFKAIGNSRKVYFPPKPHFLHQSTKLDSISFHRTYKPRIDVPPKARQLPQVFGNSRKVYFPSKSQTNLTESKRGGAHVMETQQYDEGFHHSSEAQHRNRRNAESNYSCSSRIGVHSQQQQQRQQQQRRRPQQHSSRAHLMESSAPPKKRPKFESQESQNSCKPRANKYEENLRRRGSYNEASNQSIATTFKSAKENNRAALTFTRLKGWATKSDVTGDELVRQISQLIGNFEETLTNKEEGIRNPERIEYVLTIFHKICEAPLMTSLSKDVFQLLKTSDYLNSAVKCILNNQFIISVPVFQRIFPVIKKYLEFFPDGIIDIPIDGMYLLSEDEQFRNDLFTLKTMREKWYQNRKLKNVQRESENTFRSILVYPTDKDVYSSARGFLHVIPSKGGFASALEYLSTQFHLLREDLIAPLREGIWEVKKNTPFKKRKHRLWQLTGVSLNKREWTNKGLVHCLQFDTEKTKNIKWKYSKRLHSNNLICLSRDKFQSFVFGTVVFQNIQDLEKGIVKVKFLDAIKSEDYFSTHQTDMIVLESNVLLEAYTHVLEGLKEIDENNFPFYDYIINCKPIERHPKYVNKGYFLNLNNILHSPKDKIEILSNSAWPHFEDTKLNQSQFEAFKSTLTNEFIVIQGPPGTGKTYLSLEIADSLLTNKNIWSGAGKRQKNPLLVVSYTNHALDQFVEGLIDRGYGPMLLRIGGKVTDALREYSLFEQRSRLKKQARNSRALSRKRWEIINSTSLFEDEGQFNRVVLQSGHVKDKDYSGLMKESHFHSFAEKNVACQSFDVSIFCVYLNLVDVTEKDLMYRLTHNQEFEGQGIDNPLHGVATNDQLTIKQHSTNPFHATRLRLYKHWLETLRHRKISKRKNTIQDFEEECMKAQEYDRFIDKKIIEQKSIIAMTTTGAAKNRHILKQINPKVVIIEEAAEVLESHVITSLTSSTEHLILTGDHKQLKPKPSVFKLAKDYNLDLSLFERMVTNGIKCYTLNTQHRMRPEISKLMKHIYPNLEDGDKVKQYEQVKGVTESVFFINHTEPESDDECTKSKSNNYEVKYLVKFCRYLLKQGYKREQITILTGYIGQVLLFKKEMPFEEFKGVRVTSIDNFQGEENDIVLVSLVRSNGEKKLGFMKNENRVCVTLSRAKIGLFVIGNLEMFSTTTIENNIWGKILEDVKAMKCFGKVLKLCCQNHAEVVTDISTDQDFSKVQNGGCNKLCDSRLKCGHTCPRKCHVDDTDHKKVLCGKKCEKPDCKEGLHLGSICMKDCHDESVSCMKCLELVATQLGCGHVQDVPCSKLRNLNDVLCRHNCERVLSCEHICQRLCGQKCVDNTCVILVEKQLRCGHKMLVPCSSPVSVVKCNVECTATLECGHKCSGSCAECLQGRMHVRCKVKCGRWLICSHICQEACTKECPPCPVKCEVKCKHNRCSDACGKECKPCREKCGWTCKHKKCTRKCHEICKRKRCNKPCRRNLKCGHPCIGLCGEKCPNLCRECNKDEVQTIFLGNEDEPDARFIMLDDCKHVIEVSALDTWMDGGVEDGSIKFKECPKCKTIIRSSRRYGNQIKQVEKDINKAKAIIRGKVKNDIDQAKAIARGGKCKKHFKIENEEKICKRDFREKKEEVFALCKEISSVEILAAEKWFGDFGVSDDLVYYKTFNHYMKVKSTNDTIAIPGSKNHLHDFLQRAERKLSITQINQILIQAKFLFELLKLVSEACKGNFSTNESTITLHKRYVKEDFHSFLGFITMDQWVSEQYLADVQSEFERFQLYLNVLETRRLLLSLKSTEDDVQEDLKEIDGILETLWKGFKIENANVQQEKVKEIRLKQKMKPLSEEDRTMIVKAMAGDVKRGAWYKCMNGHIYAIANCGGANQKANCPECQENIGGTGHRLADGNQLASEMDGASYSAWSEQANMRNYQL